MTAEWSIESKRSECIEMAARWATQRAADLRYSDPRDAVEFGELATEFADLKYTQSNTLIIDRFIGDHRFLSNFWPAKITYEGIEYPTIESAFQAAKTHDMTIRHYISTINTPREAKKVGRNITPLRDDWNDARFEVMATLLRLKFSAQHPNLVKLLLGTGNARLIEGNTWHDRVWGVCYCRRHECGGTGANMLGHLLTQRRRELLLITES